MHVWQSDEGLPNNNVTSLAQSPDGYLWVATEGHFARFDGVHFEGFGPKVILPSYNESTVRIDGLLEDSKGSLWFATVNGPLVRLNAGVAQVFTNNLPGYIALNMVEDGEGAVWLAYHGNVVCRVKNNRVMRFTEQDGLPAKYDCAIARDNQGRIWFAKDGQFGLFQNGRFKVLARTAAKSVRLAGAKSGGVWVCSARELFKCDESGTMKSLGIFRPGGPDTDPTAMLEDRSGAIWMGTGADGLFRWGDSGFETIPTSHPCVSSLLEDHENNIWAGTSGGGLDRIRVRAFTLEGEATGLPSGTVQSVCEDNRGAIWIVNRAGQLVCRTNGSWNNVSDKTNWPGGKATCVAADRDGTLWIGTRSRALICLRDGQFKTWRAQNGFLGHVVRGLLPDTNGDMWVVEEDPGAVQRFHTGEIKNFNLPAGAGVPRAVCRDVDKNVWVGTSKGLLLRIHDDLVTDETSKLSTNSCSIRSLAATEDGSLWIGYSGCGVGRFKNGRQVKITSSEGLYNDHISQIVSDGRGWLWFGSDRGIFKVRRRELGDVAEGRATRVLSVHYGEGNGLPSLQASVGVTPNVLLADDERIWFPSLTALAVVDLNHLQEDLRAPLLLLKQVTVDDRAVASYGGALPVQSGTDLREPQALLRLEPNYRRLEFEFSALCLSAPGNIHFQCRLKRFDDNWVDIGAQRSITYGRIPAGTYQFQVRAENGVGAWSVPSQVSLVVTPFFWQTLWFNAGMLALFAVVVVAIVRYVSFRRLRLKLRALEKQAALDKERSRIARDIHDDLGGSLTQIKLLFELAQRKRMEPDKVDILGREGLATTRQLISSMDEIVWAVNPRNDSLSHLIDYLGQFGIEFLARAGIRCRVDLPDRPVDWAVSPEVRHNLFLAVKEALNNVVLHARANEVWLRISATERMLTIIIEDNGHGFQRKTANDFADGLPNMNQRMTEIGGWSSIESKTGNGTRVSLTVPKPEGA
jgi:signal transduction histidine kinase/ligand-binding sensor domain-containing protein